MIVVVVAVLSYNEIKSKGAEFIKVVVNSSPICADSISGKFRQDFRHR